MLAMVSDYWDVDEFYGFMGFEDSSYVRASGLEGKVVNKTCMGGMLVFFGGVPS